MFNYADPPNIILFCTVCGIDPLSQLPLTAPLFRKGSWAEP